MNDLKFLLHKKRKLAVEKKDEVFFDEKNGLRNFNSF